MQRINVLCAKDSNQPATDTAQLRASLERKKSLIDFRLADIADAKRTLGMDSRSRPEARRPRRRLARGRVGDERRAGGAGRRHAAAAQPGVPDGDPTHRQRRRTRTTATSWRRSPTR